MRTIAAVNCQGELKIQFNKEISKNESQKWSESCTGGAIYGLGQASTFYLYGACFYAGAIFTIEYGLSFKDMFRAVLGIFFAAFGAGLSQQFLPDAKEADRAARGIFEVIEEPTLIKNSPNSIKPVFEGRIEFKNVDFRYPGRENMVFKNLSFVVEPNQTAAFSGPSGTGKSTIFALLFRFYEP